MNPFRIISIALVAVIAAFAVSCAISNYSQEPPRLRFAVIGNTSPESPFSGFNDKFADLIRAVNFENPVIVVHTGNMIHGGHDWMGINEKDMARQFDIFFAKIKSIKSPVYAIPGEKDCYNTSSAMYETRSGKSSLYSFNYDRIHIVMLPLVNMANHPMDDQIQWMEKDLEAHRAYPSILLVTHMPLYNATGAHLQEATAERIHGILRKYPVKGVFSGSSGKMFETVKDGIRYIVTGCGGFSPEDKYKNFFQFYIAHFNGQEIYVEGKKLAAQP